MDDGIDGPRRLHKKSVAVHPKYPVVVNGPIQHVLDRINFPEKRLPTNGNQGTIWSVKTKTRTMLEEITCYCRKQKWACSFFSVYWALQKYSNTPTKRKIAEHKGGVAAEKEEEEVAETTTTTALTASKR